MKFGKQIQKKQLEIPEYAASFVNYKALKKLIKELQNSPITRPGSLLQDELAQNTQLALQANRGSFFFRLDRELDKVNAFYTIKESESRVRLRVLIDKQRSMRLRHPVISRNSTQYVTLEQGFRDFIRDLSKLQQFIEINATAFSKILKKWDKTSKSQTKEQYLSRAVEVQPVFNRDVISELSDQAATSLLDCAAWAEGEGTQYGADSSSAQVQPTPRLEQNEAEMDLLEFLYRGDNKALADLLSHLDTSSSSADRTTKAFLTAVSSAPESGLDILVRTGLVDFNYQDEINDRNSLHKAAMAGRRKYLQAALAAGVDTASVDAYGRIPLHYASMNGHIDEMTDLINADASTTDVHDLDNFTALIHAIVHSRLHSVRVMLGFNARVDRVDDAGHIPLNLACQYGSLDIVKLLLDKAPIIMPDAEGLFPQHLVARFGTDPRILLLLRDYGVDLNQPDKLYGWTPLFHAASEGRVECLRTLLDCGVDTDVKDEKGQAALYYATWEGHLACMTLLAVTLSEKPVANSTTSDQSAEVLSQPIRSAGGPVEQIPDLSLPPPIIPTRRYGHNFLDNKSTILITFDDVDGKSVKFYDESKYPAARLTTTPRSADALPRNLLLPMQEESRCISFETDAIDEFAIDFDVYPTFGKKVIAKGSVPPEVFKGPHSSSGNHYLSLFDPRLRTVGQLSFKYQIIRPFLTLPRDMTPFATYWKATSQLEDKSSSFVTGSSLSGDYIRLILHPSQDNVPVSWPSWYLNHAGLDVPLSQLSASAFQRSAGQAVNLDEVCENAPISKLHELLCNARVTLEQVLNQLDARQNIELHIRYPTETQQDDLHLGQLPSINSFADSILGIIFHHTKRLRSASAAQSRSIVLSSHNADLCTALNWKQPNYPVLLCNDLGTPVTPSKRHSNGDSNMQSSTFTMSIKEAVRIASTNNFMGITCQANILASVPALVEAIKEAGLVLVSDASSLETTNTSSAPRMTDASPRLGPEGVDGSLSRDGVLYFERRPDV